MSQATVLQQMDGLAGRLERLPATRFSLFIILIGAIAFLIESMDTSVIAAVLGPVQKALHLSKIQSGELSIAAIGTTVLAILAVGPLTDLFGRKRLLVIGMVLAEVFTLASYYANSFDSLLIARLLTGIGLGLIFPVPLTYMCEFVNARWRGYSTGICNSVLGLGYFLSLLLSYFLVPRFGYHVAFLIPGVLIVLVPAVWFWAPESPRWLTARGRYADAEKIVRGIEEAVRRWTKRDLPPAVQQVTAHRSVGKVTDLFTRQHAGTTIALWVMFSMTFVIFYTRLLYMPYILGLHHISYTHSLLYAAIMNFSAIPGNVAGGVLMTTPIGRRGAVALYGVATALFVLAFSRVVSTSALILTGAGIFWFDTFAAQKMLINESYPTGLRGTGASTAEFVARSLGGIIWAGMVPTVIGTFGLEATFTVLAVGAVVFICFPPFFVRETRTFVL